jgi:glutamyl-tRNA reductase
VGDLADVFLYTVDDLSDVIDENRRSREQAAKEAEGIIEQGMQRFISEYRASNAGSALKLFREKVETLRELELQKALHALTSGAEPETVVKNLARNLSNKLAHDPTVVVRDAASEGDHELAEHMLRLFKVDSGQPNAGDEP